MATARTEGQIAVLLVDDHPVVQTGYRRFLESDPHLVVVGEASNCLEALNRNGELRPDVVVLDVGLPDASGTETLRRILAVRPEAHVLMFDMYDDAAHAGQALKFGALGYVSKASEPEILIEAVRAVGAGRPYISPEVSRLISAITTHEREIRQAMSSREHEVLKLLSHGCDLRQVGEQLGISTKTAANLQTSIKEKLGVSSALQLVVIARRLGLDS